MKGTWSIFIAIVIHTANKELLFFILLPTAVNFKTHDLGLCSIDKECEFDASYHADLP